MSRLHTESPSTCVTCEVEIVGPAVFHVGLPFCCAGCVAGGPCACSYDLAEPIPVLVGLSSPRLAVSFADDVYGRRRVAAEHHGPRSRRTLCHSA